MEGRSGISIIKTGRVATYVIASTIGTTSQEQDGADYVTADVSAAIIQTYLNAATGGKILFRGTFTKSSATNLLLPSNIEIELQGSITLASSLNVDAAIFENADQTNGNSDITIKGGVYDLNYQGQSAGEQTLTDFVKVTNYKIDTNIKNYTIFDAWLKESTGEIINRRFMVRPILFDSCEDKATWVTATGTIANDTDAEMGACIKLTGVTTTRPAMDKLLPAGIDAEAYLIDFWIKFEDVTKSLDAVIGGDKPTNSSYWLVGYNGTDAYRNISCLFKSNIWYHVQVPLRYYTSVLGAPAIRVRFLNNTAETASIWIKNMWLVPSQVNQSLSFMFDDGLNYGASTQRKIAIQYGHKMNIGPMGPDTVGTGDYFTIAQLDLLYYQLGWDIFTHAETHWNTTTTEAALAEASVSKRFDDAHGWSRASSFIAFPGHDCTAEAYAEARKLWIYNRNSLQTYPTGINDNPVQYAVQVSDSATSFTMAADAKDAIRRHLWTIYYAHYVGTGQMHVDLYTDLCAWMYNRGVRFKTISEVLKDYPQSMPAAPLTPGEQKVIAGVLKAGNANAICFALKNPYGQDAWVDKVVIEIATAGGTANSKLQVGIADSATGTNIGEEFFPAAGIDLDTTGIYESRYATDTGVQVKVVTLKGCNYASDQWICGKILAQNASNLVGKYYAFLVGK